MSTNLQSEVRTAPFDSQTLIGQRTIIGGIHDKLAMKKYELPNLWERRFKCKCQPENKSIHIQSQLDQKHDGSPPPPALTPRALNVKRCSQSCEYYMNEILRRRVVETSCGSAGCYICSLRGTTRHSPAAASDVDTRVLSALSSRSSKQPSVPKASI